MCRPLKEIITELENKYSGFELLYDIEQRHRVIAEFNVNIRRMFIYLKKYGEEVEYVVRHKMDPGRINQITVDMIFLMHHFCESLVDYDYAIDLYPMNDFFENNKELLKIYHSDLVNFAKLFNFISNKKVFEKGISNKDEILKKIFFDFEGYKKGKNVTPTGMAKWNLVEVQKLKGLDLVYALSVFLKQFEAFLVKLNNRHVMRDNYKLETIYERNYLLYAKRYWSNEVLNFRAHIIKHHFRGKYNISVLEKLREDALRDFEFHTESGKIWRYYSEDKSQMARQMRERSIDEDQWFSFFRGIFEIEEYDRWIDELRKTPESDEDKQKRDRLMKSNKIFNLQPSKSKKKVDVLLLYIFIRDRFITEKMFVYEWYALYYIFRRVGIITSCTIEDFEKQMNDDEWFAHVDKKCSANEINTYGFLTDKSPDDWDIKYKPQGTNKASKKAVDNIYRKYSDLEDSIDEIYAKE